MKLGKHIFNVGAMTGVSRIFGFIRDVLIARFLGAGRLSDIFFTAFKLPNLFRDLLGEGAISSIFIPMFAEQNKDTNFAKNVFSWLMTILLGLTIIFQIFMPIVILILTPGFADDPEKLQLTILISRIMFFYVIFICGSAFLSAVLNAFSKFALVAFMPVMLNLFLISALLFAHAYSSETILYILSGTVVLAGITQLIILLGRIRKNHFGIRLIIPKWTPRIKQMFKRLGINIVGSGFYQINIVIGTLVASFQSGAISWLYYSDRIVQLPFAIIGLSAGTVLLSSISDAVAKKNMRSVYIQQNSSLRRSLMLTIPSVIGLFVLANPIIKYLFQYGAWSPESTTAVATAIMIQVLVLPAMVAGQVFSKTLYADQDVKTPVKTSIIALIISSAFYIGLFPIFGYLAIPIGTVIGGYIKNSLMMTICHRRKLFKINPKTIWAMTMFIILSAILGTGLWFTNITSILSLILAIAAYGILYLPIAFFIDKKIIK